MDRGAVQAIGAAFGIPRQLVVTIATGPGFSSRRASVSSQSRRTKVEPRLSDRYLSPRIKAPHKESPYTFAPGIGA